jgi:hypothetical protein
VSDTPSGALSTLEERLRAFWDALRRGERPDPERFLPDDPARRREALAELEYLERFPELADEASVVQDMAEAEFRLRRRRRASSHP